MGHSLGSFDVVRWLLLSLLVSAAVVWVSAALMPSSFCDWLLVSVAARICIWLEPLLRNVVFFRCFMPCLVRVCFVAGCVCMDGTGPTLGTRFLVLLVFVLFVLFYGTEHYTHLPGTGTLIQCIADAGIEGRCIPPEVLTRKHSVRRWQPTR